MIEPAGARRIYVSVPGNLISAVQVGCEVAAGRRLAQLADPEMDLEIARLRGQCNQQRTRLANLNHQQIDEPQAGSAIPTAEAALADLERRLDERIPTPPAGDRRTLRRNGLAGPAACFATDARRAAHLVGRSAGA